MYNYVKTFVYVTALLTFSLSALQPIDAIPTREDERVAEEDWWEWAKSAASAGVETLLEKGTSLWQATQQTFPFINRFVEFTSSTVDSIKGLGDQIAERLGISAVDGTTAKKDGLVAAAYSTEVLAKTAEIFAQRSKELYLQGDIIKARQLEKVAQDAEKLTAGALLVTSQAASKRGIE